MKPSSFLLGTTLSLLTISVPAQCVPAKNAPSKKTPLKSAASLKPRSRTPLPNTSARSWVSLKASTDQARYTTGQPIHVTLTATNTSKRSAYLQFSSGQRFDLAVYPVGRNTSVYTWSASRMFIQELGSLWLKPGQSQNFEATIGEEMGQLKAGRYRLVARLTNSPRNIVAPPITFEITDVGLSMSTRTDKPLYKIGEPVRVEVAVTNRLGKANRVRFDSGLDCDVFIRNEAGNPVWNYGANLRFIRVLGDVTWQKEETKKYSIAWDGTSLAGNTTHTSLQPGRYQVQAVLQSTPQLYAEPVFIELTR